MCGRPHWAVIAPPGTPKNFITKNKPPSPAMKKSIVYLGGILAAVIFCFCGCGQKSATNSPETSSVNYPLPDPPVMVNCTPGIRGGRFILGELREPKTFNFLIADDLSSRYVGRVMFWPLLNFDVPT